MAVSFSITIILPFLGESCNGGNALKLIAIEAVKTRIFAGFNLFLWYILIRGDHSFGRKFYG